MARMVDTENWIQEGPAVALSVADVMSMDAPVRALDPLDRARVAQDAMDKWGFAGVGVRRGDGWAGVFLVSSAAPRGHPLSAAGLSEDTAGLVLAYVDPPAVVAIGKRLCTGLSRRLRNQVSGVEAQASSAGLATPLAPSALWLAQMGFQPMRYPLNRYRLDFSSMAAWVQKRLTWHPHPVFSLSGQTASRAAQHVASDS